MRGREKRLSGYKVRFVLLLATPVCTKSSAKQPRAQPNTLLSVASSLSLVYQYQSLFYSLLFDVYLSIRLCTISRDGLFSFVRYNTHTHTHLSILFSLSLSLSLPLPLSCFRTQSSKGKLSWRCPNYNEYNELLRKQNCWICKYLYLSLSSLFFLSSLSAYIVYTFACCSFSPQQLLINVPPGSLHYSQQGQLAPLKLEIALLILVWVCGPNQGN